MRSRIAVVITVVVLTSIAGSAARAEPTASAPADATADTSAPFRWALGVSSPIGWFTKNSFGGSLSVGTGHHAVRANAVRYAYRAGPDELVSLALNSDASEESRDGHTTDVGIGYIYFPERFYDGPLLEFGLLGRFRDTSLRDDFAAVALVETDTTTLAGTGLIGWSWLFRDTVYLSTSVGVSIGRETGSERTETNPEMMATHDVDTVATSLEAFLRIGVVFEP